MDREFSSSSPKRRLVVQQRKELLNGRPHSNNLQLLGDAVVDDTFDTSPEVHAVRVESRSLGAAEPLLEV